MGLRDDIHERDARTVDIHQAVALARLIHHVLRPRSILFKVDARDSGPFRLAFDLDFYPAVLAERQIVLRDLVALHQVRVVVVLPVKLRLLWYLAVESKPRHDRKLHRALIDDRENARHAEGDRADRGIGRRVQGGHGAGAEHYAARQQLGVDLQAYDRLVPDGGSRHGIEASIATHSLRFSVSFADIVDNGITDSPGIAKALASRRPRRPRDCTPLSGCR